MASKAEPKKRNRKPKPVPTPDELRGRANVSIEEGMILTGFGRDRVTALCDAEDGFDWFWEGKRRRIITDSIFTYQQRQAAKVKRS